jgi:hypothetical protein
MKLERNYYKIRGVGRLLANRRKEIKVQKRKQQETKGGKGMT